MIRPLAARDARPRPTSAGDYIQIDDIDYETDGDFTIAFWITKNGAPGALSRFGPNTVFDRLV